MIATTGTPRCWKPSAISIGTTLHPDDEMMRAESSPPRKSKFLKICSANPLTFSRNIACRCPFAPDDEVVKGKRQFDQRLKPGNEP
jgi:hypothetical protein